MSMTLILPSLRGLAAPIHAKDAWAAENDYLQHRATVSNHCAKETVMKTLLPIAALCAATAAGAQAPKQAYPSCDLAAQQAVKGTVGGGNKDAGQAHIATRSNVLQADIGSARKAGRLSPRQADALWKRVETIRRNIGAFVSTQGFLSAAERATYDRQLDAIAEPICRA